MAHTHPLGQAPIATVGYSLAQSRGGPIEEIHPEDVTWFSPGDKHLDGATAATQPTF